MATRVFPQSDIIIRDTHRGLWYEDGKLSEVLAAGRYRHPESRLIDRLLRRVPVFEIQLVDMREQDLTIKGQEILTSDKVAIRVSILVQFRVTDPETAMHAVANYEDRLYSDVQLAARRSLAAMTLEQILTNRNRLSEEILTEVQDSANGYGVKIRRADVKDLIFPGNLQEIMNRVLAAERNSEAQLVEARTRAEVEKISAETQSHADLMRARAEAEAESARKIAAAEAELESARLEAEAYQVRATTGQILDENPSLMRMEELKSMAELGQNANARIYFGETSRSANNE